MAFYECCVLAWGIFTITKCFYVCSTSFTCNVAGFSRPGPSETALFVKVGESEGEWGKGIFFRRRPCLSGSFVRPCKNIAQFPEISINFLHEMFFKRA